MCIYKKLINEENIKKKKTNIIKKIIITKDCTIPIHGRNGVEGSYYEKVTYK
jgi:hypothetical protein